jgi:hypothetical protein
VITVHSTATIRSLDPERSPIACLLHLQRSDGSWPATATLATAIASVWHPATDTAGVTATATDTDDAAESGNGLTAGVNGTGGGYYAVPDGRKPLPLPLSLPPLVADAVADPATAAAVWATALALSKMYVQQNIIHCVFFITTGHVCSPIFAPANLRISSTCILCTYFFRCV